VDTAPSPTFYAGSPMQLDFGEAGELKTYNVLEVSPAGIHALEHVAYQGARPLTDVRMNMAMLEQEAQKLRHSGWLRVTVPLDAPQPDINGRVRRLLPNAVTVEVELPDSRPPPMVATGGLSPGQLYAEYVRLTRQEEANPTLAAAFAQLHADAQE
jgi:exonuclease SbcD